MKKLFCLTLTIALLITLTACGSSSYDYAAEASYPAESTESYEMAEEEINMNADYSDSVATTGAESPLPVTAEDRKIIYTTFMDMETTEYDKAIALLESKITSSNGYVSSRYSDNPSSLTAARYSTYTIRIPYNTYSDFMSSTSEIGSVLWSEEVTDDVTLDYIDVQSRISSLEAERESLLELLKEATDLESIVAIQSYLGDVQYEYESYMARQRRLDDLIQYCTITINLHEVKELKPVESSFISDFTYAVKDSALEFVSGLQDFIIVLVYVLPGVLVFALFVFLIVFIILKCIKRSRKKAALKYNNLQNIQYNHAQGNKQVNAQMPQVQNDATNLNNEQENSDNAE